MRERLPPVLRRLTRPRLLGVLHPRPDPVSERWGTDRGTPIDRYYIEAFLDRNRRDIRGRVLEVKDDGYARRFGDALDRVDVLDIDPANRRATIVADLASADVIGDGSYGCFVLTQTLQYVREIGEAIRHAHRILEPGGVLLATVPSITRMTTELPGLVDYWHLTEASCRLLFGDVFGDENVAVESHGNAAAAEAFLAGLATEELSQRELDRHDPRYPVVLCIRAVQATP